MQYKVVAQKVNLISVTQLQNRISNGKDTTFIVNFWATWCVPCVAELPNFEKFSRTFIVEKQKVLLVSVNFKSQLKTQVLPFVKKRKIATEVLLLNETTAQEYIERIDKSWSGSIPATLFVKNGKRIFAEKELTYNDLIKTYKTIQ